MSKKLVAYFSASGVTARIANTLANALAADTIIKEGILLNGRESKEALSVWIESLKEKY